MISTRCFLLCSLLLLLIPAFGQAGGAQPITLDLQGEWQTTVTHSLQDPGSEAVWQPIQVPQSPLSRGLAAGGSEFRWFRKRVSVPAAWQGRHVFLYLGGARYHPRVLVDGQPVAERLEGWTPFEVELTDHLSPGSDTTITVICQDWGATFADGYTLPADASGDLRRDRILQGKVIAPVGGHWSYYGIWDRVSLIGRPKEYLDDIVITPSVRQGNRLTVSGRVVGERRERWVSAQIVGGERLGVTEVNADGRWTISTILRDAHYWSPEDPSLYQLSLELHRDAPDGEVLAHHEERFGFRELWVDGPDFYLNGIKRHLLATSGWPTPAYQQDDEIREALLKIKAANCIAFRLHTQPWQERWLEIADEVGLLIVEEGALWCDGTGLYAYKDERYWKNVGEHLSGMVRRDRNHASLVIWSLENEILHCGASRYYPETEGRLAEIGRSVKALDPSHLITYEADLDPGGVADVIGLHYPHEMPNYTDYPNTADWLDQTVTTGTEGGLMGSRGEDFRWDRQKPLYIGEYLWVPWENYAPGSIFFGDEAYLDQRSYYLKAKALAWEHQTLAYRRAGVSGLCPWTFLGSGGRIDPESPLYRSQQKVYAHVAVFPHELDTRFFSGETVGRTFDVFNDGTLGQTFQVRLELNSRNVAESAPFVLEPGGYRQVSLKIALPTVSSRAELNGAALLLAEGEVVHRSEVTYSIFPKEPLRFPSMKVGIYDPAGKLASLPGKRLGSLANLPTEGAARVLLILGPDALMPASEADDLPRVGDEFEGAARLRDFLAAGGKVLVLEQGYRQALSPLGVTLVEHPSTMTFPTEVRHPLLRGIARNDWKFWRGDHYVSRLEIQRPESHGARTLVVSGGIQTLAQGCLTELKSGKGTLLLIQALVGEKLDREPTARRLLQNALDYLGRSQGAIPPTYLISPEQDATSAAFAEQLRALGVDFETVTPADLRDLDSAGALVLLHGGGGAMARMLLSLQQAFVEHGAPHTLYWHAPEPKTFGLVAQLLRLPARVIPSIGPVRVLDPEHPLFAGVYREDLLYIGEPGERYHRFNPDPTVIDRVVMPALTEPAEMRRFEAEEMVLSGTLVSAVGDAVHFATNGVARAEIRIDQAGLYSATLLAAGSAAAGVYPHVVIRVDGKVAGEVMLSQAELHEYPLLLDLPVGKITCEIAFVNDFSGNGEDRNLRVDALLLGVNPLDDTQSEFLTMPPAVAQLDVADGMLSLVVDGVRWDRTRTNRERGHRYASALLANLGARFQPLKPEPFWILPRSIEPVGEIPYFRKDDQEVSLVAAGTVSARFECAAPGRYMAFLQGRSAPALGEYARARLTVDGKPIGEIEIASPSGGRFPVGVLEISEGIHELQVSYTNDLYRDGEDRNLYLHGVGFRRED